MLGPRTTEQVTRRVLAHHPDLDNRYRDSMVYAQRADMALASYCELVIARAPAGAGDHWLELEAHACTLRLIELSTAIEARAASLARIVEPLPLAQRPMPAEGLR